MNNQFLNYINEWFNELKPVELVKLGIGAEKTAVVSVDMIKGFCSVGPLASSLVSAIVPNIVELFNKTQKWGVDKYLLFQDNHSKDTPEFSSFPKHCLEGSTESETIDELKNLSFSDKFIIFPKNSLSPAFNTKFDEWLSEHRELDNFIIVGNCTDLCIYSHAMHLRLSANAYNLKRRIIIPENCVATYDISIETARKLKAMPHDAESLHKVFLYHLSLNGIEVDKKIIFR